VEEETATEDEEDCDDDDESMSKVRAIPPDTKESPLSPPLPPPIDVEGEDKV
jgi:hypothetical protein